MTSPLVQARLLTQIPAHRRVASLLEGEYAALHPGRSTDFTDLREYVRGDDPKDLDWKASARARTLLVRRYHALRKLTLLLVVSSGRSMTAAASLDVAKHDVAVAVAGVLGHLAVRHGDLVGMVHGDRDRQVRLPARGGPAHVDRCLRSVREVTEGSPGPSDLTALLRLVARSVRRRCLVVVVTDTDQPDPDALTALRRLLVQHEVLVVVVDSLSPLAPDPGRAGPVLGVDDGAPVPAWLRAEERLRQDYADLALHDRRELESGLDRLGLAHVRAAATLDVVPALRDLLERHRRGRR